MERESEIKRIRFRGIIGRDYLDLVTVFCLKNLFLCFDIFVASGEYLRSMEIIGKRVKSFRNMVFFKHETSLQETLLDLSKCRLKFRRCHLKFD